MRVSERLADSQVHQGAYNGWRAIQDARGRGKALRHCRWHTRVENHAQIELKQNVEVRH